MTAEEAKKTAEKIRTIRTGYFVDELLKEIETFSKNGFLSLTKDLKGRNINLMKAENELFNLGYDIGVDGDDLIVFWGDGDEF